MGQQNSFMYKDGDVPRNTISSFDNEGKGFAYYSSTMEGKCSKCSKNTYKWFVHIKSINGRHLCESCRFYKKVDFNQFKDVENIHMDN